MLRLVIFDCDGVLVDSEPISTRVFAEELNRAGVDWPASRVAVELTGLSDRSCIELVERTTGRRLPAGFLARVRDRTYSAFRAGLRPIDGIEGALERIGLPSCIASSGDHERMRLTLGLTGLLDRFRGRIFSAEDVARGKPFPDLFLHSARALGVDPREAVVVEDSMPGVRAARAAGMTVLGFAAAADGARLARDGARVFGDMRELPELIESVRTASANRVGEDESAQLSSD
ncbi:MAG TPA: HAD family hydrolase [Candidatus Polarisedimenticolaceae bacterium]|nr:HAD family hydrolase [Candidatus Polarisedimenticolaceae bacterium]